MGITVDLGKIKFNWRGSWSSGTSYTKDDVVSYSNSSFVCVADHSNQQPNSGTDTSYWHRMAVADGTWQRQGRNNPYTMIRSRQNLRRRYYDYWSGYSRNRSNVAVHCIEQMWNDGKISVTNSGDVTSHRTSNPWNGIQMIETDWDRYNFSRGFNIKVPANTDIIKIMAYGEANNNGVLWSLTDPSTGRGVCYNNCSYDNRYYSMGGWHTGGSMYPPFGGTPNGNNYWGGLELMVPRLSSEKTYIMKRGHASRDQSWAGWLGGVAFIDNPWGLIMIHPGSQYERHNGGDEIWHDSWNWNEQPMMHIHQDYRRMIKVPVTPQNNSPSADRLLFFNVRRDTHDQQLKHCVINGKRYQLTTDLNHPVMNYMRDGTNYYWGVVGCIVKAEDIPSSVRSGGGVMDVTLDNYGSSQDSNNGHHWYFGYNGTAYIEPESSVQDNGEGRTTDW